MTTIRCRKCGISKPLSRFPINDECVLGVARRCKECAAAAKAALVLNPDWIKRRDERRAAAEADGFRVCSKCRQRRPVKEFAKSSRRASGFDPHCFGCSRADYKKAWIRYAVMRVRVACRHDGTPFDLTTSDICIPDRCPVLGIPLEIGSKQRTDNSPSLDRHIPHVGYVRGNVEVISWRANRLKNNCADPAVFEAIARYLRERLGPKEFAA